MDFIVKICLFLVVASGVTAYFLPNFEKADNQRITAPPEPNYQARAVSAPSYTEDPNDLLPARAVRLQAARGGHFHLDAKVNGASIPFLVDTGATFIALSYDDARRAGFRLKKSDFTHQVSTANGIAKVAPVTLNLVRYESIRIRNVQAFVSEKGALGGINLLGNSFLSRLREYSVRNGELVMIP